MLQRLLIKDFVIVESLEIEFSRGFSAFTGETGAGKSILLDALGLALGARLAGDYIRANASKAEVAAEFDIASNALAQAWLNERDYEADAQVLLRRVVEPNGRTKAYINGRAATASDLRALADLLIHVHGQHDNMQLATADAQRIAIDRYAQAQPAVTAVAQAYAYVKGCERDLREALEGREQADIARELIDRQLSEIKDTGFVESTWADEQAEHMRLAHSQELLGAVREAVATLAGDDDSSNDAEFESSNTRGRPSASKTSKSVDVITQLAQAQRTLQDAARHDAKLIEFAKALDACAIAASDVSHDLNRYLDKLELDPALFEALDAKVGKIHALARKLRIPPAELAQHAAALTAKRAALPSSERIEALEQAVQNATKAYHVAAAALTKQRAPACTEIAVRVRDRLAQLAMPFARFEVRMLPQAAPTAFGAEAIEFAVSMNPGLPLGAMAQIASGGELSRIGLALQVEMGAAVGLPVMVFDEVDTGVSGRVAQTVGELLHEVAIGAQVLAVTHLPQVAANAGTQYRVSKMTTGNTTATRVDRLSDDARIEELARMLSGAEVTPEARAAAQALVTAATIAAGRLAAGATEAAEAAKPAKKRAK